MSTPATNRDRPLSLDDADGCAWLRDAFVRAGYQSANLLRLFGLSDRDPVPVLDTAVCLRRLRDSGPLATLARLFQLRESVPDEAARVALAPLEPARVQAMGLLEVADGEVTAPFTIAPFDELLLVSDWMPFDRSSMPADCVTGLNPTTVLLAHITIRRPVGTALDMCTGNGAHALLAARHAGHVVATDVNPRALNMTAFNALLNAVDGIECRQGSLYDPVDGETFDVIVANPPFVISPEGRYLYRDGNPPADAICAELLTRLPGYLREGGIGHVLANWVCRPDGGWTEPLQRWLHDRGCDVLALMHEVNDPITYAARWLRADWASHPDEYRQALDRWLSYYRACGIEAIAAGGVVVRKRSGRNWFEEFSIGADTEGFCGEQLHQLMRIQDYCADHLQTAADLLECRLELRDHTLEQVRRFERGRYDLHASLLRVPGNLAFPTSIDSFGLRLLSSCNGRRTLREVLADVAAQHDLDVDNVIGPALASVRLLLARGFLLPAGLSGR